MREEKPRNKRSTEIYQEVRALERQRMKKIEELMADYDREVHYPAKKALQEECGSIGHVFGNFHNNGFGWTWSYCNQCGAMYDVRGPEKD